MAAPCPQPSQLHAVFLPSSLSLSQFHGTRLLSRHAGWFPTLWASSPSAFGRCGTGSAPHRQREHGDQLMQEAGRGRAGSKGGRERAALRDIGADERDSTDWWLRFTRGMSCVPGKKQAKTWADQRATVSKAVRFP
ncbi:hypothetical protein S7711_10648 [Stachybotrys chartarum IBT 7711]|uniref:Uncharacterized protein n=1 Tax=Stachybotrys chartarum (strain CBS 109288 / IBT 7711) TaxID=1280523 RepID=A0A084B2E2_STACB|nr:hypothetical protein S7711_10648 [Stachybotrys chartarum IBT 7711]